MDYFLIAGGWIVYLAMHSVLASGTVKRLVEEKLPVLFPYYRFFYSLINTFGFFVMLYFMLITPSKALFPVSGTLKYAAMVLASYGTIILVVSFRHMSGLAFLGLKKEEKKGLIREGLHSYVRHPIYSGTILVLLGLFLYNPTDIVLITDLVIFGYLPFGIYFEERKLIAEFGEEYLEYKKEVKAIIPRLL